MKEKSQIRKRVESFFWRLGSVTVAFAAGWTLENLELLELSPLVATVVGLFLGEVTKYFNTAK